MSPRNSMKAGPRGRRASVPMAPRDRSRAVPGGSLRRSGPSTVRYDQSGIARTGSQGSKEVSREQGADEQQGRGERRGGGLLARGVVDERGRREGDRVEQGMGEDRRPERPRAKPDEPEGEA